MLDFFKNMQWDDGWGFISVVLAIVAPTLTLLLISRHRDLRDEYMEQLKAKKDRDFICLSLKEKKYVMDVYNQSIRTFSARFDGLFGRPISLTAFSVCLRLALFYPFVFMMIGWAFGGNGALGSLTVLDDASNLERFASVLIFITTILFIFYYFSHKIPLKIAQYFRKK